LNKLQRRQEGIKRAKRVLLVLRGSACVNKEYYSDDGEYFHKLIKTRVPCSCPFCGNPRRHFGIVTRQELRETA